MSGRDDKEKAPADAGAVRRGNLEEFNFRFAIQAAQEGHPAAMPRTYRTLARALREGNATPAEIEFVASRLEAVAASAPSDGNASADKKVSAEVCRALLLSRGRGRFTAHGGKQQRLERAVAMHELVRSGMRESEAAAHLAQLHGDAGDGTNGYSHEPYLLAYAEYREAFD